MRNISLLTLALTGALVASATFAQQDPLAAAVKARHSHMTLLAANIGVLGGMAQGKMDYNAEDAQAAADNIAAVASIDQRLYWLEGTAAGEVEDSRALPAIWEDMDGFHAANDKLGDAAEAMQAAAGESVEALQGAMGGLGKSCGGCHETFRQSE